VSSDVIFCVLFVLLVVQCECTMLPFLSCFVHVSFVGIIMKQQPKPPLPSLRAAMYKEELQFREVGRRIRRKGRKKRKEKKKNGGVRLHAQCCSRAMCSHVLCLHVHASYQAHATITVELQFC